MLSVTTSVMVVDTAVNVRVDIKVMAIVCVMSHHNIVIILNKMVRFEVESFF
jgi:peptide subunit release factor RF-3